MSSIRRVRSRRRRPPSSRPSLAGWTRRAPRPSARQGFFAEHEIGLGFAWLAAVFLVCVVAALAGSDRTIAVAVGGATIIAFAAAVALHLYVGAGLVYASLLLAVLAGDPPRPCPFCGAKVERREILPGKDHGVRVRVVCAKQTHEVKRAVEAA